MRLKTAIVAAAFGLLAQGAVRASPDALIEALDHPEYAQRERATQDLTEAIGNDLKRLEALIRDRELSPEQYARLEAIGWELFRRGPRAGLGVSFGASVPRGVQIAGTVQGFNAADVLLPADIILEMDGRELDSIDLMRYLIVARDPGDVMRLKVVRQGREIDARVQMGSFQQLNGRPTQMEPGVLEGAWSVRVQSWPQREAESESEVQFAGPPAPSNPMVRLPGFDRWLAGGEPLPPPMVAGSEPRGGLGACGRLLVRISGIDLMLAPIPVSVEAIRARSERVMADTINTEMSQTAQVLAQRNRDLEAQRREAGDEEHERITEEIRENEERLRLLRTRSTEGWDLYESLRRPGR